jgi:hypothetical protein
MDGPTTPDLRLSSLEHRSMRTDAARLLELIGAPQRPTLGPRTRRGRQGRRRPQGNPRHPHRRRGGGRLPPAIWPRLVRVLYRLALRPRYQRLVRPLSPTSRQPIPSNGGPMPPCPGAPRPRPTRTAATWSWPHGSRCARAAPSPDSWASPCQWSASWNTPMGWSATPCSPSPSREPSGHCRPGPPAPPRQLRPGHAPSGRHPHPPTPHGPNHLHLLDRQGLGPPHHLERRHQPPQESLGAHDPLTP